MTYTEALAYLYDRLPVFHRIGPKALKPGLANSQRLSAALGEPHLRFKSIHVAGTNGKGSTSHMLASVYQAAGYRVGLYTSPHLKSFTERIRINGEPIPETWVANFVETHQQLIEAVSPSFFEVTVLMAFAFFAEQAPDLVIVEVGLGGRLDSTNIITPELSVITNIGWDHMDVLGDTLAKIAAEKAGIMKPGVPVVIGERHPETEAVFARQAAGCGLEPIYADTHYQVVDGGLEEGLRTVWVTAASGASFHVKLDLTGLYQLRNLRTVLTAIEQLQAQYPVSASARAQGLCTVTTQTGLQGRFQTVRRNPWVVADTAHNVSGMEALLETIGSITHTQLHLVIGFVADKDIVSVLNRLPRTAAYYLCQPESPRALPVGQLASVAASLGITAPVFEDVNAAVQAAMRAAAATDLIVVTGSTYLIAQLDLTE